MTRHHVLVLGGTGAIGSAVLRVLAKREVEASFTYSTQGIIENGVSTSLAMERRKDYEKFSALGRVGSPEEAARAICWLALETAT